MNILVIHGPNMNLIGLKNLGDDGKLTLNKLNTKIRLAVRNKSIKMKIVQSHSESKIVSYLHRNRKKIDFIIISPETWAKNGYLIMETLELIKKPVHFILPKKEKICFDIMDNPKITFYDENYLEAYLKSIDVIAN